MSEKFTVYGKKSCSFCIKAVELLDKKMHEFTYIDVTEDKDALTKIKALGCTTVPQIFETNMDIHIGGYSDLENYFGERL